MKRSEAPERSYKLRLQTRADLARVFAEVMACPHVEGCVVEEATRTLSFTAPSKFAALIMERAQAVELASPDDLPEGAGSQGRACR